MNCSTLSINPSKIKLNFDMETSHYILVEIFDFQTFYDVMKSYKNQFHKIPLSVLIESCLQIFITTLNCTTWIEFSNENIQSRNEAEEMKL